MFSGMSSCHPAPNTRLNALYAQAPLASVGPPFLRGALSHALRGSYASYKAIPTQLLPSV